MYNTKEYTVRWIKPKHKFVVYYDELSEQLHLSKQFGFTDFSKEIDETNCDLTCDVYYVDEKGNRHIKSYKHRSKYCGRELIIYNDDDTIKFDEWIYIDTSKPNHNIYDINGYELTFGG